MPQHDDRSESEGQRRRFSRRAFLTGGAAVGGLVLWGSADAAEALTPRQGLPILGGIIPHHAGTGGTGTGITGAAQPNIRPSGSAGGPTGFTVETALAPVSSGDVPLFRFRFR